MLKESPTTPLPVIFTAQSKTVFYCRDAICQYVFEQGRIPLNPFRLYDYFLSGRVPNDHVRQANNTLIQRSDELWVFGPISDGVFFEVDFVLRLGKPVRMFTVSSFAHEIHDLGLLTDLLADGTAAAVLEFEEGFPPEGQTVDEAVALLCATWQEARQEAS